MWCLYSPYKESGNEFQGDFHLPPLFLTLTRTIQPSKTSNEGLFILNNIWRSIMKRLFLTLSLCSTLACATPPLSLEDIQVNRALEFQDGCHIAFQKDGNISIRYGQEQDLLHTQKGITFQGDTGETVTEYRGIPTTGQEDYSWAMAVFNVLGTSPEHYHSARREDYYVTSPNAHRIPPTKMS
jgi:hypothetical protein